MLTLPGKYLNMKVPLRSSLYEEEGWPLKPIKLSSFTDQPCNASPEKDAALGAAPLLYRTAAPTSGYYSLLHNGRRLSGRGRLRHAI